MSEPTTEQIEYAAMAAQAECERNGWVPVQAWSQIDIVARQGYRNIAKAAIDAYREGHEDAAHFLSVYAEVVSR